MARSTGDWRGDVVNRKTIRVACVALAIVVSSLRDGRAEPPAAPTPPPTQTAPAAESPSPAAPGPQSAVPSSPSSPLPPRVTRRTVAFVAAGIAVVGAGLATTFGVLALNNKSAHQNGPTLSNADDGNNDAAYADGALALTIVAAVTSLVLFLTDDPAPPSGAHPPPRSVAFTASPFVTSHGGGAGALLRF
jgi:hypothetical protein